MDEQQTLKGYMDHFSPLVQRNTELVAPMRLLHISVNPKIGKFIPQLSRRTAKVEDRSVPRISTAPTIVGCLAGYMADLGDFENGVDKTYKGGWYIYTFDQWPSVRPKAKILYDVEDTDEHWLVPYRADLWVYPAVIGGKCFYSKVTIRWEKNQRCYDAELYVEVYANQTVAVDREVELTEGCWALTFVRGQLGTAREVRKLTPSQYAEVKGLTATLLSHTEPASAGW